MKNLIVAFCLLGSWFGPQCFAQGKSDVASASGKIAAAGKSFLASLDETQRGKVVFGFKDEAQRKRWSNLPVGMFKREG